MTLDIHISARAFEQAFIAANPERWGYTSKRPEGLSEDARSPCLVCGKGENPGSVFCPEHSSQWAGNPVREDGERDTVYEWAHGHAEFNGHKLWWAICAVCDGMAAEGDYLCHSHRAACGEGDDRVG